VSVRQRLAFALIAVVIAVVAVVAIASGGGSDDGADRASSTDAVTAPEATPEPEATQEPSAAREPEPTPTRAPVPKVVVKGGEPVGGVEEIEATEGERIRFTVVSDVADHVHVHGYDLMKDVSAGGQATFSFKATITGIFEAELEDRGEQVVSIRVDPK
jgi:hypothetical protein